ncbi:MAG TPA: hypothetical protein VKE70_38475 [Candidatus Solibacter sp.]|nr:hypothetical protein [Candidatus Solibacter sp.]
MRQALFVALVLAGLAGSCTSTFAQESRVVELPLPRALGRGESVELQIKTGALPRGGRLVVMSDKGETLGVLTPFGLPGMAITGTVPVPRAAITDGRLRLRLQVVEPSVPSHAPRADEVDLKLVIVPRE